MTDHTTAEQKAREMLERPDILTRLNDSSANESSHELQCRCFDAAEEIIRLREELATENRARRHAEMAAEAEAKHADRLRKELDAIAAALPDARYMDPPDGGDVSLAEQVRRMSEELANAQARGIHSCHPNCARDWCVNRRLRGLLNESLDLLAEMFDAYEDGTPCYEDPENYDGFLGHAFKINPETFQKIADLLNTQRPRVQQVPEGE